MIALDHLRLLNGMIIAAAVLVIGCDTAPFLPIDRASSVSTIDRIEPIRVVATVGMVADIAREVGGSRVEVDQLMGPGVDPHLYKGTRDDVRKILAADIVLYSGLMLEGKLVDMLEKVSRKKPVMATTRNLDRDRVLQEEGSAGNADPHVWMDVAAWATCVDVVAQTLADHDPGSAATFHASAQAYRDKLQALHQYGLKVMATVPPQGRVLITSHDAFQYFGRAYGLEVFGVQGLSTDSEAGLRQINSLVDMIVQRKIAAVFVESSVPRKSIFAVVDGVASRGHRVIIGGELYSDAMGPRGTYEGTYVGMLDHNLTLVARSLGGRAPRHGMQGSLQRNLASHE